MAPERRVARMVALPPGYPALLDELKRRIRALQLKDLRNLQQPVGELDGQSLPQPVAEIPWGHNIQLLAKLKAPALRLWYARQALEHGWSRAVLVHKTQLGFSYAG